MTDTERQNDLAKLRGLRPMDDDFMRCMFHNNAPLAQFVLRILTGKPDLVLDSLETQKDLKRLVGARSIILDVFGTDSAGRKYDLEIHEATTARISIAPVITPAPWTSPISTRGRNLKSCLKRS